jgi:hypothetical protein
VDRGWIEPGRLRVISYGAFTSKLPSGTFSELLERLKRDDTYASTEAGLAGLFEWSGPSEAGSFPEEISAAAWQFLEMKPTGFHSAMYSFYWARLATRLLPVDPPRLAQAIIEALAADDLPHDDERLELLKKAWELDAIDVWTVIGAGLLAKPAIAITLSWRSEKLGWFETLPPEVPLAWAREDKTQRPELLAQIVKPREVLSPLVREILIEYGAESGPASILASNFSTGSWWGSMAAREERQMEIATAWLDDPEPEVRRWASQIIESIRVGLPHLRLMEEEASF